MCLLVIFLQPRAGAIDAIFTQLKMPQPGDHALSILTPNLLELVRVNSKLPDPAHVDSWDWVTPEGNLVLPNMSGIRVIVNGQTNTVTEVGFKRRPFYAPLEGWDLRVENYLYLRVSTPIADGQSVEVINDGTLWPSTMEFTAVKDPLRYSPAIHVNQEGYLPANPKKAMVGYFIGNLGEMAIPSLTFTIVNAQSGATAYQGTLTLRPDVGFNFTPLPYQAVYQADFSSLTTPGEYRLKVPGLGASLRFHINEGIGMNFARAYALGLFHQRSGYHVAMPFTRFTHGADHLAPATVPIDASPPFAFTWTTLSNYAINVNSDNPPQIAPMLTSPGAQLYPFVNPGPVNVSGGHFEAANYSKVAWNLAQVIHVLMFAVDALPGVAGLDNLGVPESGDGISDVMQEAKWEADCLAKIQDSDGGFYYMIHPQYREYEGDVLPENGDPQVVWPKNTGSTAAAVAALVQCASSPRFKQAYPAEANNYWNKALLGWRFLTNAIATHGFDGSYQRMMHFDDYFTHKDDLSWAACELFLATGDPAFRTQLETWFPDPTDPATIRWGWLRMHACYGNAIRSYATAVRSGRLQAGQLNQSWLGKALTTATNCGNDNLKWSQDNAYGTSFPQEAKNVRRAGWYYSTDQAFDLVVAYQFNPRPEYLDAVVQNLNYEAGCNPVNVAYITGLGWKRQRFVVDQYSVNDIRVLPKIGIPISNIQEGFIWTWLYGGEPGALCYPLDGAQTGPYAFYDRWADFWNVSTEASTSGMVRSFAVTTWLAAQSGLATQPWRSTNATILAPSSSPRGQPVLLSLQVANPNLAGARIIWEARDQEPSFGGTSYSFTPLIHEGIHWVEAEVQWPDGRRAFASNAVNITAFAGNAPPRLSDPQISAGGNFSFLLAGVPQTAYIIQASTDWGTWTPVATNTLPASGSMRITDAAPGFARRYYRARQAP